MTHGLDVSHSGKERFGHHEPTSESLPIEAIQVARVAILRTAETPNGDFRHNLTLEELIEQTIEYNAAQLENMGIGRTALVSTVEKLKPNALKVSPATGEVMVTENGQHHLESLTSYWHDRAS